MKKLSRRHWLFLFAGFGLLNAVAFFHAWRFTHFSNEPGLHSLNPEQLSPGQKLWLLLTGIRNPKPQNGLKPAFPVKTVSIASPNGTLEAWYARPDSGRNRGTVALFHGYTSSKSHLTHEAGYFRRLGYNVLLVDQAGNGNSAGFRTTVGYREANDVAAAVRWLNDSTKHRAPTKPQKLILYGVRAVSSSVYMIAAMVKPVFGIVLAYPFGRRANGFFQRITGAGLGLAQPGLKFAEGPFNRVKIGGIRGQVPQPRPVFFDHLLQSVYLVHGQVIEHHHVARPQRGAQDLVEVGRKHVPVDGAVHA